MKQWGLVIADTQLPPMQVCMRVLRGEELQNGEAKENEWWCFLTLQVSELVRENEQVDKLQQQREDVSMDGKEYEEQVAKVVFLEEQIRNLTDEQEQLW